jgi:hypothetical protein
MMSVLNKLAHALGRRDQIPNQELAWELTKARNQIGIQEIIAGFKHKERAIQSDCIKVAYEIGYIAPDLIADYSNEFLDLLRSRNNRLVWGAMIALGTFAGLKPDELFDQRAEIIKAIENGSVITIDAGIQALATIAETKSEYRDELCPYLLGHLRKCRPKDVPQRAEKIMLAVDAQFRQEFINLLEKRTADLKLSQVKRLQKVIKAAGRKLERT